MQKAEHASCEGAASIGQIKNNFLYVVLVYGHKLFQFVQRLQ